MADSAFFVSAQEFAGRVQARLPSCVESWACGVGPLFKRGRTAAAPRSQRAPARPTTIAAGLRSCGALAFAHPRRCVVRAPGPNQAKGMRDLCDSGCNRTQASSMSSTTRM